MGDVIPVGLPLAFQLFGPTHLFILAITFLVPVAMAGMSRRYRGMEVGFAWFFIVLLLADRVAALGVNLEAGLLTWQNALPMQLCDWALAATVIALWTRRQTPFDLAYFWGLSGTLQALLTPDTSASFSDLRTWIFFIAHSGIVAAIVFLVFGGRMRVCPRSLLRAWSWSQFYLLLALLTNWTLGANYGYLCAKPVHASLLDWLGPWPLYLVSLEILTLFFYGLYYLPFFLSDWWRSRGIAVAARSQGI
ncbi:MAG: TIGR02206 family membrane protein [Chthoniobacteraceae bacterium]